MGSIPNGEEEESKEKAAAGVRNWLQSSFAMPLCHLREGGRKVWSEVESGKKKGISLWLNVNKLD